MPYTPPTLDDIRSISDAEVAFSTIKFLPGWEDIPSEFKASNRFTRLADALFALYAGVPNSGLPDLEIEIKDGFKPADLQRLAESHLKSYAPKHEHKIAGVAYLLSLLCDLKVPAEQSE